MKYAIMSDVHANPAALKTALADARALGCEKFVMLGDITGYGYDSKAALNLVRENFDVVLMGNHDSACLGLEKEQCDLENPNYDIDRKHRATLTDDDARWLRSRRPLRSHAREDKGRARQVRRRAGGGEESPFRRRVQPLSSHCRREQSRCRR